MNESQHWKRWTVRDPTFKLEQREIDTGSEAFLRTAKEFDESAAYKSRSSDNIYILKWL